MYKKLPMLTLTATTLLSFFSVLHFCRDFGICKALETILTLKALEIILTTLTLEERGKMNV